jgi:hypothetical protein
MTDFTERELLYADKALDAQDQVEKLEATIKSLNEQLVDSQRKNRILQANVNKLKEYSKYQAQHIAKLDTQIGQERGKTERAERARKEAIQELLDAQVERERGEER